MMNIGLITSMKYGLTQFIFRDIQALMEKGHQIKIFTLHNNEGLYNPLPDWEVIPVSRLRMIIHLAWFFVRRPKLFVELVLTAIRTDSFVDMAVALSFIYQIHDIDVLYAYFGDHKLYTGYYLKRMTGIPLVVTIRAYELYRNPNPKIFIEALDFCDRIVTITEFNKDQLVTRHGIPASKIDIVRQIVDLDVYKFEPKFKILIVGYFAEKKGHEILFKAFKQLNRDDVELWVVGNMNPSVLRVDCHRLAKELDIESKVAFFGAQSDAALRALYRECDVFCLPSRVDRKGDHEGFPNVIAEAMAFSKPIISTQHAGIPEAIDSILVEENNVDMLADALNQALDSVDLRTELGERNRKIAEKMFSGANNDELEAILQKYAHRTHPGEHVVKRTQIGEAH